MLTKDSPFLLLQKPNSTKKWFVGFLEDAFSEVEMSDGKQ